MILPQLSWEYLALNCWRVKYIVHFWLFSDAADQDYEPSTTDQKSDSENVENESHPEPEAGPSTVQSPVKRGRPSKPFSELGKDAKLAKIDEHHNSLDGLSKKLDVSMVLYQPFMEKSKNFEANVRP